MQLQSQLCACSTCSRSTIAVQFINVVQILQSISLYCYKWKISIVRNKGIFPTLYYHIQIQRLHLYNKLNQSLWYRNNFIYIYVYIYIYIFNYLKESFRFLMSLNLVTIFIIYFLLMHSGYSSNSTEKEENSIVIIIIIFIIRIVGYILATFCVL